MTTLNGQLREIRATVQEKQARLRGHDLSHSTLEDARVTEEELWTWFFRDRLRMGLPSSIAAYAAREGTTLDELRTSVLRAFVFERLCDESLGTALRARPTLERHGNCA